MKRITLVIPVYNEGLSIAHNLRNILEHAQAVEEVAEVRLLVIDDGSTDDTVQQVATLCEEQQAISLLSLNRNFGKEAAILAGLSHAEGDSVIVMDSDLQHPPRLISQMVSLWLAGADVVEAYKKSRGKESLPSRLLANGFHTLFKVLSGLDIENQSDYKLLDRKVVDTYIALPERTRFFRGLIKWMNYPAAQIYFDVPQRSQGQSSWTRLRLLRFSLSALSSFSSVPLHLVTLIGLVTFGISIVLGTVAFYYKFSGQALDGFTTVIVLLLFIGSALMFSLGLLGSYVARIYDEVKSRPNYLINWRNSHLKRDHES